MILESAIRECLKESPGAAVYASRLAILYGKTGAGGLGPFEAGFLAGYFAGRETGLRGAALLAAAERTLAHGQE